MLSYIFDENSGTPLYEALYQYIRSDIISGKIRPNQKLPSKRSLAENLHVSINTVSAAYDTLKAEGYIRYGFDNPALTGKAAGILYLLLPADSEKFDIKPDFQEKGLDVNAVWRGHIRLNHLAAALLSLFIKKQFREFLKGIKHRGGNRNG